MKTPKINASRSRRAYAVLLAAYPREFRREYGREMALVFDDRCRERSTGGAAALARLWGEALLDLALTAPREHLERLRGGGGVMKTLRTVATAVATYAFTLLVVAPLYARNTGAMPGFVNNLIDALISTGLIFNFVFLVLTLTRRLEGVRAVRAALALTTLVVGALITLMEFSPGAHAHLNLRIVVAQVLSLLVWFTAHLWWVLRKGRAGPPATA
ncbi:MAG TPA: hypothetical protein VKB12_03515 [Pyrinomonadaceae bacterium]|nr:hypothetical protein [Pyrinomonadaceae bacterium]